MIFLRRFKHYVVQPRIVTKYGSWIHQIITDVTINHHKYGYSYEKYDNSSYKILLLLADSNIITHIEVRRNHMIKQIVTRNPNTEKLRLKIEQLCSPGGYDSGDSDDENSGDYNIAIYKYTKSNTHINSKYMNPQYTDQIIKHKRSFTLKNIKF